MNTRLAKLNANTSADKALQRMLVTINTDFPGGRVTKTQLLTWIISNFEKGLPSKIEQIRREHFDHVAHLENLLKKAKRSKREGAEDPQLMEMISGLSNQLKAPRKAKTEGGDAQ